MRKTKLLFALLNASIYSSNIFGQITYESSYPGPNSLSVSRLLLTNISTNEYKYEYVDYASNQLKLFNLNHTPFLTVNVPVTLISEAEHNIGYVTRTLFDCDSTQIEYAILPQNGARNFYIYREDGTLLFQKDSTIAPYCFGCLGGWEDIRPITNSSAGAKLFLMKDSPTGFMTVDVYGLCGSVPVNLIESKNTGHFVKVYPNPSAGLTTFQFDLPGNTENYSLMIYNSAGQIVRSEKIAKGVLKFSLDNTNLSAGVYLYSLQSQTNEIKTGKFIIAK